jgi:adenylate cyclase
LGLSIAQELVELHGGVIAVSSELDKGSSFAVYLPLLNRQINPD